MSHLVRAIRVVGDSEAPYLWSVFDADTGEQLLDVAELQFTANANIGTAEGRLVTVSGVVSRVVVRGGDFTFEPTMQGFTLLGDAP